MSTKTPNLGLTKPAQDEYYDVDIFNENADIVDAALADYDGRYKVGDIITTARKDMSGKWALCNGAIIPDKYSKLQELTATTDTFPIRGSSGDFYARLNGTCFQVKNGYKSGDTTYTGSTISYAEEYKNKNTTWTEVSANNFVVGDAMYINGMCVFIGHEQYKMGDDLYSPSVIRAFTKASGKAPVQKISKGIGGDDASKMAFSGSILAVNTYIDSKYTVYYTTDLTNFNSWTPFTSAAGSSSISDLRYEGKYWCIYRTDGLFYSGNIQNNSLSQIKISGYTIKTNFVYLNGKYYLIAAASSGELHLFYSTSPETIGDNSVVISLPSGTSLNSSACYLYASQSTNKLYLKGTTDSGWSDDDHIYFSPNTFSASATPTGGAWTKFSTTAFLRGPFKMVTTITPKFALINEAMSYLPELPTISPDHAYAYIKRED